MKVGSLFAGIGGFDLAAEWMGWKTAWFSEIDPYACEVLRKRWPDTPNYGDIRSINGRYVEAVELLVGGFPCQDISYAGRGEGIEGARSGLWGEYARLIEQIRPKWVVAENVSALKTRGLDRVLKDLSKIGYDAEWHCIPASYVGAPHRRDRIWIIAYPNSDESGLQRRVGPILSERSCEQFAREMGALANSKIKSERESANQTNPITVSGDTRQEPSSGSWWNTEPNVGRVANGIPSRVDRLKCLGNAVVPQAAYFIFKEIQRQ